MEVRENECQISNYTGNQISNYTSKILKMSCVKCNSVKFDIPFLGLPWEILFGVTTDDLLCKRECNML